MKKALPGPHARRRHCISTTLLVAACCSCLSRGDDPAAGSASTKPLEVLIDPAQTPTARLAALKELAETAGPTFGARVVGVWSRLTPTVREAALQQIVPHEEASLAFLNALATEALPLAEIDARTAYRLRTHPSERVRRATSRTTAALENERRKLLGSIGKDLTQHVAPGSGDIEHGAQIYETHCSVCHEFAGRGKDLGPHLGGLALSGREALLAEILDPSRTVAGEYAAYTVVMKTGEVLTGMIASENADGIVLRSSGRSDVLRRDAIGELQSAGASAMPEGYQKTLQPEALRDLIAYLRKDAPPGANERYRALSFRVAANGDGSQGLYTSTAAIREALPLKSYGTVEVAGVPFTLLHPTATDGRNLIALRGGAPGSLASTYPLRAELQCGARVKRLHFLGAVGGWGFPTTRESVPVVSIALRYKSDAELHVWNNGVEVADSHRRTDVPGSTRALRLGRRQVRLVSIDVTRPEELERVVIESANGPVAPIFFAVTAELAP
jgi:putative heme-binding domain-containing protein